MTKQELQKIFESPFDWNNWRKVMDFVFPEFNFSAQKLPLEQSTKADEERIEGFYHHGSTSLTDHITLNLYEVELKGPVNIPLNIKGIRKFIANEAIANTQVSIAVFYSPDKSKWRFTLAVKQMDQNFKEIDRKPDSYTYVFGEGERGRTASERFFNLSTIVDKKLKDLEEAFSVEALSRKFFAQYKAVYKQFVDNIVDSPSRLNLFKSNSKDEQEKMARDFVKKMMGRIVFLYFLQKKGWMGCKSKWQQGDGEFMQSLFKKAGQDNPLFYSHYLQPLFFDTLNAKRTAIEEDCVINGHSFGKVPFLNGGLFEREANHPDSLTLDWNIFFTLFEILNSYNFTIIEDDPNFKEVAVDPEMLGHIFENLLEENRNNTGAFYTPKEIVQYMCQESLIEYLNTQLSKQIEADGLKDAIREFVLNQKFVGLNDINQQLDRYILRALRDIKVCDPAIGSGAFPMGILHEIFRMVETFEEWDTFRSIWEMDTWDAARVKEDIIQNSIYGVDMEKGAVDIARLRFWLSIIIDEEDPKPLPNLDYKIMQGDSLLERFGSLDLKFDKSKYEKPVQKQANLFGEVLNPQLTLAEAMAAKGFDLAKVEKEYFHTEDPEIKEKIRKEITDFEKSFIDDAINRQKKTVFDSINTLSKKLRVANYAKLSEKKKDEKLLKNAEEKLVEVSKIETESKRIKEGDKPYFLWNLYFMDIFEKGGFDIVIGNPPYVQLQSLGEYGVSLEEGHYYTYSKSGDIYSLFYELGFNLINNEGCLVYITSNKWMRTGYGKLTRKYFLDKVSLLQLIDFGDARLFENATTYTNILLGKKGKYNEKLKVWDLSRRYKKNATLYQNLDLNSNYTADFSESSFLLASGHDMTVKNQIEKIGTPLKKWNIEINYGIKTGFNDAFLLDKTTKDRLIREDNRNEKIIKPILRGRDIKKYKSDFDDLWLICSHNGLRSKNIPPIDIVKDYPSVYRYLSDCDDKIKTRSDQGHHWTNLRNCAYLPEFEKPKIVWAEIVYDAAFYYDQEYMYLEATGFLMTGECLKYLLALLNSKPVTYFFKKFYAGGDLRGGTFRYKKAFIENLPIPKVSKEIERPFEIIADYIQTLYKWGDKEPINDHVPNKHIADVFEEVTDAMVLELYFKEEFEREKLSFIEYASRDFLEIIKHDNPKDKKEV